MFEIYLILFLLIMIPLYIWSHGHKLEVATSWLRDAPIEREVDKLFDKMHNGGLTKEQHEHLQQLLETLNKNNPPKTETQRKKPYFNFNARI
jgi:hypothetical protein